MLSLSLRAKALFLALGIFAIGAVCGALGERWFVLHRFPPFTRMGEGPSGMDRPGRGDLGQGPSIRRMARDLDLTEEQQEAISEILNEYHARLDTVRREVSEKMRTGGEEIRTKIRAELTDEQREKFDQMKHPREQRWRGGRSGRGGRGGRGGWGGWGGGPPKGPGP